MSDSRYSFQIWSSNLPIPLVMFKHLYIIIREGDETNRYEVLHKQYTKTVDKTYLRIDHFKHKRGLGIFYFPFVDHVSSWPGEKIYESVGGEGTLAQQLVQFVRQTPETYPHVHEYLMLPGPNSNTYVGWIVSQFPEVQADVRLSKYAVGHDYNPN